MLERSLGRCLVGVVVLLASIFGGLSSASAAQLLSDDQLELNLNGYGAVLTGAEFPEGGETNYGATLDLARLKLSGSRRGYANFAFQIGESGGDMVILDAMAEWTAFDPVYVRAGRFKTSVSHEYLVSAADLKFVSRALLNNFVPRRRLGVETYGELEFEGVQFRPQLGIFQPQTASFENPQGELLTGRLLVRTPFGLGVHAGYAGHVFDENRLPVADEESVGAASRVVAYDDPVDVAFTYRDDRLDLHLEGVVVLDSPTEDSATAGYGHAAYRLGPTGAVQFEPALAYDIVDVADVAHRITGGVNVYWWDTGFKNILDYRYLTSGGREVHSIFLLFHGGV